MFVPPPTRNQSQIQIPTEFLQYTKYTILNHFPSKRIYHKTKKNKRKFQRFQVMYPKQRAKHLIFFLRSWVASFCGAIYFVAYFITPARVSYELPNINYRTIIILHLSNLRCIILKCIHIKLHRHIRRQIYIYICIYYICCIYISKHTYIIITCFYIYFLLKFTLHYALSLSLVPPNPNSKIPYLFLSLSLLCVSLVS